MKTFHLRWIVIGLGLIFFVSYDISAQEKTDRKYRKDKEQAAQERDALFAWTCALINLQQFAFQAEFDQGSGETFVLVDTSYGEVQNGNRNNLEGEISKWEVNVNERKRTVSVSFIIKSKIYSADVFLLIGEGGNGQATVRRDTWDKNSTHATTLDAEFSGGFSFHGKLVDFEHCTIYEGKSHLIH